MGKSELCELGDECVLAVKVVVDLVEAEEMDGVGDIVFDFVWGGGVCG